MTPGRSRSVERFLREAETLGLRVEIRHFPEGTRTAEDAAAAIGCHVGQIVKSLVFMAGSEPLLALTSGPNRASTARLAELTGTPVRRADAEEARRSTGYSIGGTPPFGHPRRLRALCDRDLLGHDEVWAAAGTPTTVFPVAPADLLRASGAEPADFRE
jgi:prolyl-tRNA editing enzyme YbaK/EbsC (Cys-tRNA(Pro) deacylase)